MLTKVLLSKQLYHKSLSSFNMDNPNYREEESKIKAMEKIIELGVFKKLELEIIEVVGSRVLTNDGVYCILYNDELK